MGATLAGFIIGLILGIGLGRLIERARRPPANNGQAPKKPFEEFKKGLAKFIVITVVILVLIAIGRRR